MAHSIHEELIKGNKMYQMVTERLDRGQEYQKSGPDSILFDRKLIETILEFYDKEDELLFPDMRKFSPEQILAYLKATHRYYLNKLLPEIEQSVVHIFTRYRESHGLLSTLVLFFNDYKEKLVDHIKKEERDFFPYAQQLMNAQNGLLTEKEIELLLENDALSRFSAGHGSIEDELGEVNKLICSYSGQTDIPLPYRIFLNQVQVFELELKKHAIIEDYVFLPMLMEMRGKLNRSISS